MYKHLLFIVSFLLISCHSNPKDYTGIWVDKQNENKIITINKKGDFYLIENEKEKFVAQIIDGLLEISASSSLKAHINKNDELIIKNEKYIRIERSKIYRIAKFVRCEKMDMKYLYFEGIKGVFEADEMRNQYSKYKLCVKDSHNNWNANPKYVGKKFIIKWDTLKPKVNDSTKLLKTSKIRMRITYLKLVNEK